MSEGTVGCYHAFVPNPNDIWKSESVAFVYLPVLAYQMILIVFGTRFLYYIMRPLNQPRLVTDLIAGILLSSGFASRNKVFVVHILPVKSVLVSTTISYVGIIYYVFLSGLEMNLDPVLRAQRKPTTIAIAGTAIPMGLGIAVYIISQKLNKASALELGQFQRKASYFMWSLVLSVTGFPVLTEILADLKILYTGLGELALAAGTINDFYNWFMFAMITPFVVNSNKAIYSVLSTLAFVLFSFFVVRPFLRKVIVTDSTTNKNDWDNYHLSFVVMGVFVFSAITDLLGTNPIVGALLYGLIIPRGKFTENLIEKSDDFGSGYLAPVFFASCGMRFNIFNLIERVNVFSVFLVILLSSAVKVIGTVIASGFYGIPFLDSVALGVLMNSKGILSLIMLNLAWDKKILSADSFAVMLLSVLIMTILVAPTINAIYKPRKLFEKNKLRTIQMLKAEAEIKVLACCHNTRHTVGMIKILEALSGINVSPMHVSVCQLVELKGRATAMLSAHIEHHNPQQAGGSQELTQSQEDFETMTKYFEAYAQDHEYNHVDTQAIVSAYETIHHDIYNLAMEKSSSLVLLPFHKHATTEGTLDMANEAFRQINQNVIKDAPCSVGLFVERNLVSLTKANWKIITVFIGGPDDREALAVAWRMSRHPRIQLTFVRIMLVGNAAEVDKTAHQQSGSYEGILSTVLDTEKQKKLDDEYVSSFRLTAVNNEDSITYLEKEVRSGDDVPRVLNELDQRGYDLYILGHRRGRSSIVLADLWNWCDCPELGVLGDMLTSSSFGSTSSVLVVQQYVFGGVDFGTSNTNNNEQVSDQPVAPAPGFNRLL